MSHKEKKYNAGPLGLLGFGLTTILLNLENAHLIPLTAVIISMGIALGGLAQIIAGILEFKANNTFAGTAFTAYGLFWWSLVLIWTNDKQAFAADNVSFGFYLLLWGLFTVFMFIGTLKHNVTSRLVFGSLAILFFGLSLGKFTEIMLITQISGYIGIICGLLAFYNAMAQIVNEEFDKQILPL